MYQNKSRVKLLEKLSYVCVKRSVKVCNIIAELLLLLPLLVLLLLLSLLIICWPIHLQWVSIQNFNKKNRHPRYTGPKPPRRLEDHLNLSLMPNSDHVSTGIKPLCLNIVFNKNPSYRNQSIDTHCRSMNWFETTRVFTERNFWTKIYENKHSPGQRT